MSAPAVVTKHESDLGAWENISGAPDPRLRSIVLSYEGYTEHTDLVRRQVPSGSVTLILGYGAPLRVSHPAGRVRGGDYRSFVAGMHDSYVNTASSGPSAGVQVNLTPLGAYLVLGVPMHTLADGCTELDDVIGEDARVLPERLHDAADWNARFAMVDDLLASRLANARPASPAVAWAWRALEESHGRVSVGALAEKIGWSRKHLVNRFREQIGQPPKTAARILRFRHAMRLIERSERVDWADIACRCGYYDQAHLIRDFGEFAGSTPREFLGRRLPDGGGVRAAR